MRSLPQALIWETLSHGRWSIVGCFLLGNLVPLPTYGALLPFSMDPHIPELLVLQACFLPIIIFQFAMGIVAAQGANVATICSPDLFQFDRRLAHSFWRDIGGLAHRCIGSYVQHVVSC